MTTAWDSSALVKLYADEDRSTEARRWREPMVTSALSIAEVVAALWGKVTCGELAASSAAALDRRFMADVDKERFALLPVGRDVLLRSTHCSRRHRLRAGDAIQLASALLARDADPGVATLASFDQALRDAASAEGFVLLPA